MIDITTLIAALGGYEALKWIISSIVNRKTNARKENASANSLEISNLLSIIEKQNHQIERYDSRLKQRDDKVDAIYHDWRTAQNEVQLWTQKYHEIELKLAHFRCDVEDCTNRKPPRYKLITNVKEEYK